MDECRQSKCGIVSWNRGSVEVEDGFSDTPREQDPFPSPLEKTVQVPKCTAFVRCVACTWRKILSGQQSEIPQSERLPTRAGPAGLPRSKHLPPTIADLRINSRLG